MTLKLDYVCKDCEGNDTLAISYDPGDGSVMVGFEGEDDQEFVTFTADEWDQMVDYVENCRMVRLAGLQ